MDATNSYILKKGNAQEKSGRLFNAKEPPQDQTGTALQGAAAGQRLAGEGLRHSSPVPVFPLSSMLATLRG